MQHLQISVFYFLYKVSYFQQSPVMRHQHVIWEQKVHTLPMVCKYRKIPKISHGAYIFQRPFLRGIFLERLIFGGAYLRREICVSKSIELAFWLEGNLSFLLCFTLYLRTILQIQAPGGLYLEGRFNGGFFALPV